MKPEAENQGPAANAGLRIDRLLWMLRFAHSRSSAQAIVAQGHVRRNRQRVKRIAQPVVPGDVLTFSIAGQVRVIEMLSLPARRGPAIEARGCYRDLSARIPEDTAGFSLDAGSEQP